MVRKPKDARSIEARYIADVHYLYQLAIAENSARQMALSAFDALLLVGGYWLFHSPQKRTDPNWEPEPEMLVTVPMWVVLNLASAWIAYPQILHLRVQNDIFSCQSYLRLRMRTCAPSRRSNPTLRRPFGDRTASARGDLWLIDPGDICLMPKVAPGAYN